MAVSRRRALQIGAGAGVVAAVPAAKYAAWSATDRTRDGFFDVTPTPEGVRSWSNWSGNQAATPQQIATPGDPGELADLMKSAPGPIRPVGSGHSFTALVPSEGSLVDIGKLAGLIEHDSGARTATMGAGTRLRHAARLLDEVGLGFDNLPDIDVQTLAGSFSTGTHGTGSTLSALHDHAYGLTLVTPGGDVLDITRDSYSDLFAAAKVSLGALGVITRYRLNLRESYALRRRMWVDPVEEVLERPKNGSERTATTRFTSSPTLRWPPISPMTNIPVRCRGSRRKKTAMRCSKRWKRCAII
ncbi:FAD-binding protein [Ruegeria sp. HKCCD8929]|uniref:FAD-binding protein n=1 Tax=Ruegeria sp. HKCCD8929 TaxID=2683006 RepID=UPI001488685C|nr:FAD-binding protein [Ruegeria sp. HKCCD8929]